MQYFNFERLIEKYSCEFTAVVNSAGEYDDSGEWVSGESREIPMTGAIIGFKESKLFRSGGTLTAKDKHLFMLKPFENALKETFVIYKGEKYNVEAETDNGDFTGFYVYVLKYVSAFDKRVNESDRQ